MSNRSIPRKPLIKAKPPNLQGTALGRSDEDWLNENLLDDGDDVSCDEDDVSCNGDGISYGGDDISYGGDDISYGGDDVSYDGDDVSSPTPRSADFSQQLDSHDQGPYDPHDQRSYDFHDQWPYRLVIAIDYGTAFTCE